MAKYQPMARVFNIRFGIPMSDSYDFPAQFEKTITKLFPNIVAIALPTFLSLKKAKYVKSKLLELFPKLKSCQVSIINKETLKAKYV